MLSGPNDGFRSVIKAAIPAACGAAAEVPKKFGKPVRFRVAAAEEGGVGAIRRRDGRLRADLGCGEPVPGGIEEDGGASGRREILDERRALPERGRIPVIGRADAEPPACDTVAEGGAAACVELIDRDGAAPDVHRFHQPWVRTGELQDDHPEGGSGTGVIEAENLEGIAPDVDVSAAGETQVTSRVGENDVQVALRSRGPADREERLIPLEDLAATSRPPEW